jgi:hypothetical protein
MKRSTKLAFSLVLAAALVVPALAQDNFPDVPANHWAYEALARMKRDGLLVGYPDGLYRGSRPASRYELAVAMHAVYTNLRGLIDGLDGQLKALTSVNPQDIQNLKDEVAALQNEVNAMKGWGDDIAALKKATEQFDHELRALGVDVEAMKKDLGDLQDRVTRLEKRKPAVDISGDINFWAGTGNASNGTPGLTMDGRAVGQSAGAPIGMFHDLAILHEGAFTATGTNETGPKWKVTAVVGNMVGAGGFGNQSNLSDYNQVGGYGFSQGADDVYIQDASVKWDTSLIGLAFNIEAGRVAYELSPYLFKRIDNTPYFSNDRWDDGKYRFDGAILGFNFGGVKLHVWGGNNSNLLSVDGVDLNSTVIANNRVAGGPSEFLGGTNGGYPPLNIPVNVNSPNILGDIDKTAAVDASIPLGKNGHINLAYLWMEQEEEYDAANPTTDSLMGVPANRDQLYGGDAEFGFGHIKLMGGFHQSNLTENDSTVNDHDNTAWNAQLKLQGNRYALWGGYRQIDNNYYAPGDWGRLGVLYNPANIKGWQAGGYLHVTHALTLSAHGEWDKGVSNENGEDNGNGFSFFNASPFNTGTTINNYDVRLDLNINPNFSVFGAYEDTKFDGLDYNDLLLLNPTASNSEYGWTTVGLGYGLSSNAKLNIQYQFSNVGNEAFLTPAGANTRYTGGFLTTQLTVKF